jgi:hypothetical protein
MKDAAVTRRSFLGTSAGLVTALGASAARHTAKANAILELPGAVYGRAGTKGIAAGTCFAPSRDEVILHDGTRIEVAHVGGQQILAGKSVLLSPDENREWSVLYAEF